MLTQPLRQVGTALGIIQISFLPTATLLAIAVKYIVHRVTQTKPDATHCSDNSPNKFSPLCAKWAQQRFLMLHTVF